MQKKRHLADPAIGKAATKAVTCLTGINNESGQMDKLRPGLIQVLLKAFCLEEWVRRLCDMEVSAWTLTWRYFLGTVASVLLALLFLSGACMAFYYTPSPGAAYDSVDFAVFNLPFGEIIKGIHHYAWNLLLVVMGLHLARTFVRGAYKAPRQGVWISGVILFLFIPMFIITGDLLPWDQKGYWSTQVRLSIIASVPVVGDTMMRLLQGGPLTGIVALTRFYVLHIVFLPVLLLILMGFHFHFILHQGLAGPPKPADFIPARKPFFPIVVNRSLLLFLLATLALGLVSWIWPPPFGDPADPTDTSYIPKPEWWVLFLNQLVSIFSGAMSVVGTVIIPGGLAGLLVLVPFIDRSPEPSPAKRVKVLLTASVILLILIWLSINGYRAHFTMAH